MPTWLQIVLGLSAPLIAAFTAFTGWQQWHLAKYKLKHDLFERRWKVYAAANDAAVTALRGNATERQDTFFTYLQQARNARFLFPSDVIPHLSQLGEQITELAQAQRALKSAIDENQRSEVRRRILDIEEWLRDQPDRLVELFRPYLELAI